jgi:YebC/PmpR family DNA-binding regulatory protein
MSGHSKFANIKAKKEKNDAAKGKIFTRLGKDIMVAVKEGGADVNNNSKLKAVVAKAKAANMPNDTIDRAIKKASDSSQADLENITYEGYGPGGTAIIVEALTDNRNRAASNIRYAFSRGNGNIGTPGCVSFMFDEKGQIIIDKEEFEMDPEEFEMMVIEAGAEDIADEEDSLEITTAPEDFQAVVDAIDAAGVKMASAEVTKLPQTYVTLESEDDIKSITRLLDLLDDDEDVQNVYTNWEE